MVWNLLLLELEFEFIVDGFVVVYLMCVVIDKVEVKEGLMFDNVMSVEELIKDVVEMVVYDYVY